MRKEILHKNLKLTMKLLKSDISILLIQNFDYFTQYTVEFKKAFRNM